MIDKLENTVIKIEPKLGSKSIITNGTYKACNEELEGYSEVQVNVSSGSGEDISKFLDNNPIASPELERESFIIKGSWLVKEIPDFEVIPLPEAEEVFSWGISLEDLFYGFNKIKKIGKISVSNEIVLKNTSKMFFECTELTNVDLSALYTLNVTSMYEMFYYCKKLSELDLSSFNTSKVTNMGSMFEYCTSLKNLNISNFDFTNVTSYSNMFDNVPTDCYILVKDATAKEWIISKFPNLTNVHYVGEE